MALVECILGWLQEFKDGLIVLGGIVAAGLAIWRILVSQRQATAMVRQAEAAVTQADNASRSAQASLHSSEAALRTAESISKKSQIEARNLLEAGKISVAKAFYEAASGITDPDIHKRAGAIISLSLLAHEIPALHHQTMILLCGFIRHKLRIESVNPADVKSLVDEMSITYSGHKIKHAPSRCLDIQLALDVLSQRNITQDPFGALYDLSETNLYGMSIRGGSLSKFIFFRSVLCRSYTSGTDFSGSDFTHVFLSDAKLLNANLSRASIVSLSGDMARHLDLHGCVGHESVDIRGSDFSTATWVPPEWLSPSPTKDSS